MGSSEGTTEEDPEGKLPGKTGQKEKAGFYLSKELIDDLELVWVRTRSLTGNRVSKSQIVDFALRDFIQEFRKDPEEHQLIQEWSK